MRRYVIVFLIGVFLIQTPPTKVVSADSSPRRVNVPYFSNEVDPSQAAIFWFGQNEWYQHIPGRNYIDVRIAYSTEGLYWRATGIDYYLWYKDSPQASDDLSHFDALALYLDTGHDRAGAPQPDDYYFLVGLHGDRPGENTPQYRRQGRGTGTGWNPSAISSTVWMDHSGWQWSDTGPNNNDGNIDYGWVMGGTIPWSVLGLSGPPSEGTVWGLGVLQYDRDASSGNPILERWPESFDPNRPVTWGEIHFGLVRYQPPPVLAEGTMVIRANSPTDNTVEDAWMGGGGGCSSGHEGHTEDNHGDDESLFVGSEIQPTHFPCFNKTYLRFSLSSLPPGKMILSATLTLYHWGGASFKDFYTPSYVWLSSVSDPWDEMTIHWNNAPLAHENYSMTRIPPKTTQLIWPGDPYTWDATQAVAEAYEAGRPVSFALYDSTTGRDSSKYLTSSETGDWNVEGRPKLTVVWGRPVGSISKRVQPIAVTRGQSLIYTITVTGNGQTLTLSDNLPPQVSPPISFQVTGGPKPIYDAEKHQITWSGEPALGQSVTITFSVNALEDGPRAVFNTATLTQATGEVTSDSAVFFIDAYQVWLPAIRR